ncbi:hypothetical protein WJX77_001734 [Trebouxia sp. C0004]
MATQVEVPATGNPNSAKRVRYGNNKGGGNANASFNNISTNNRGGGRGPFTAGRGNAARGRGTRGRGGGRGSPPGQSSQTRGRGGGRGSPPGQSSQPVFDENLHCATCNAVGHAKWTCPATNCE